MLIACKFCLDAGDTGLNLVMKSEMPEYVAEASPDLIQSVPARHGDSTENEVVNSWVLWLILFNALNLEPD